MVLDPTDLDQFIVFHFAYDTHNLCIWSFLFFGLSCGPPIVQLLYVVLDKSRTLWSQYRLYLKNFGVTPNYTALPTTQLYDELWLLEG